MNTTRIALLLAGVFLGAAADAREAEMFRVGAYYTVPSNSLVRFANFTQNDNTAHFSGRFTLSGTYVYGWVEGSWFKLYFVPDKQIAARLPHVADNEPVHELLFTNDQDFIAAVVAPTVAAKLKRRKIKSITGRATVDVEAYWINVECGVEYYGVKFVSVSGPMTAELTQDPIPASSC